MYSVIYPKFSRANENLFDVLCHRPPSMSETVDSRDLNMIHSIRRGVALPLLLMKPMLLEMGCFQTIPRIYAIAFGDRSNEFLVDIHIAL